VSPEFLSENNKLTYDVYGKVLEVEENSGSNTKVKYYYGVGGQRIKKETYSGGTLSLTTWYVGSHIYEKVGTGGSITPEEVRITNLYLGGTDTPFWDDIDMKVNRDKFITVREAGRAIWFLCQQPSSGVVSEMVVQLFNHQAI